ncbi:MAG: 3-oxoacyl-[acyl-carrier-protein] synthase II [Candidatus Poriferisodalaceae bacterium]|jgi:3-oxoacyl-[acyl-carrier-protein] synthase II
MEPIAITGVGVVSPIGSTFDAFGSACAAGKVGIGPAPYHGEPGAEHAWAGRVLDFDPDAWMEPRVRDGSARFTQFALAASQQAVDSSGGEFDPDRTGCVHGTSMAGIEVLAESQHGLSTQGREAVSRKLNIAAWPNMAGGQIALRYGLHGPLSTVSTACASSADAIGMACWMIEKGRADSMLAGGSDAALVPLTFHSQVNFGMLQSVEDPRRAMMPFDVNRTGIVEGEGSAMVMLERGDRARSRGAHIYGYVVGYAAVAEAYHPSSPQPDGTYEKRVIREALADAELSPDDIDFVMAHGTGTPVGDAAEIRTINEVFNRKGTPIIATSVKGHVGHSGGAANSTALLAGLWGMAHGVVVPTAGTTELDPAIEFQVPIDATPAPCDATAMVINGFGFGGQDSCLVVTKP